MLSLARLLTIIGLALVAVPAAGQQSLGEVLDAGGKRVSATEFEMEVVRRVLIGPSPTGGDLELVYASNGRIVGVGKHPLFTANNTQAISGEWKLDDVGRACTSIRIAGVQYPYRCQHWYKLADKYFVSDSDSDRSAKVLSRTIKP